MDLVERLRKLRGPDVWEAANRIELLEQALLVLQLNFGS